MSLLSSLANKPPVISTFDARALQGASGQVRNAYEWEASMYVEQPPLTEFRQKLLDSLRNQLTPKACLVAPFGYGKTASAIGVWNACQVAGAIAIPPIAYTSFADIAKAVYEWLSHLLPDRQRELQATYELFLTSSVEVLARRDEELFGIPYEQAKASIADKLDRGYLDFEDITLGLLGFLERMTLLVKDAGYLGLVVIIDEFQQLLGNANKAMLVALRQWVWGLRTRRLALATVITMDPDTERTLSERAGDILHRIKDDGLYLDIRHIYEREFPKRLWNQYATVLSLNGTERSAIDLATLESLGQLCERDDLSNGPRTVTNVFQLAAARFDRGELQVYTPIDLVDDLLTGAIRFDGDRGLLPSIVTELLNFPYFQMAPDRGRALKLIAAFPRGCSDKIASLYDLRSAVRKVRQDLQGEIVTELDEGVSLIELQRVTRPANRLNVLLRRYWMHITDQQLAQEHIEQVFAESVLPLLFEPKVHDLNGWAGLDKVLLSPDGAYTGILEGTSSSRHPLRKAAIIVISGNKPLPKVRGAEDADITVCFRLDPHPDAQTHFAIGQNSVVEFTLAMLRPSSRGLQGGLSWIAHYLSPHPISPTVVLGLLKYLQVELGNKPSDRDRVRIEDTIARLHEWLVSELLPSSIFSEAAYPVVQAGRDALNEFLYLYFSKRWPDYETIIGHQHWRTLLDDYMSALNQLPPAERQGAVPVTRTKAEMAALFRQQRHAGLDSRFKQYGSLLSTIAWQGDQAILAFHPHSAEMTVIAALRDDGSTSVNDLYGKLRNMGYASAEAKRLLQLVEARGLVVNRDGLLRAPRKLTHPESKERAKRLRARFNALSERPSSLKAEVERLGRTLARVDPAEAVWKLDQLEQRLTQLEAKERKNQDSEHSEALARLINILPRIFTPLSDAINGELFGQLAAVHKELEHQRRKLEPYARRLEERDVELSARDIALYTHQATAWNERGFLYERWNEVAARIARLQFAMRRVGSKRPPFRKLASRSIRLVQEARSILAQSGIPGLSEVRRLELTMSELEQGYVALADERRKNFDRTARELFDDLRRLLQLASVPKPPEFDAADEDRCFSRLANEASSLASRSIWALQVDILSGNGAKRVRKAAGTMAEIRLVAQLATQVEWLLSQPDYKVSQVAAERIAAVQQRVLRSYYNGKKPKWSRQSIVRRMVSDLTLGPVDATSYSPVDDTSGMSAFLVELLELQSAGLICLQVDIARFSTASVDGKER